MKRLRSWLSFLVTLPVTLAAIVFAVANRQTADVDLWPFGIVVQMPLFLLSLGTLALGIVTGAGALWLPLLAARRRAHKAEQKLSQLTAQLRLAENRIEPARNPDGAPAIATLEAAPALPAR